MKLEDLQIEHHFVANEVYSKRTTIPAGVLLTQHVHLYDHASALISGTAVVAVDGDEREYTGPCMLMIKAGSAHSVRAITEVVWHCIHITGETDAAQVDAGLIV